MALAALLIAGGCDLIEPVEMEEEALSFRVSWGQSIRDMANAAASAYKTEGQGDARDEITVGGITHTRAMTFNNNDDGVRVSVFEYQTCQTASIVVSFRGTQVPNFCDLRDDAVGAIQVERDPKNPWDSNLSISGDAEVGRGFYNRVANYMNSSEGQNLKSYLDGLNDGTQKVNIHVVGHSLGGVSSAIFSQFLAQYRAEHFRQEKKEDFKQFNFAFNSPLGMNDSFRNDSRGFYGLARNGWFTPFGFNVEGDAVSETKFLEDFVTTYDSNTEVSTGSATYRPFAQIQLPAGTSLLSKHKLEPNIGLWASEVGGRGDMGSAYQPFPVGSSDETPSSDTPSCGCDLYLNQSCPR
ncbi:MAG: hypothetical protein K0V04_30815 [Deltaproteobacteria bacterium]|nr:hypothetical protein [Deltaproteobacteria bacterium]